MESKGFSPILNVDDISICPIQYTRDDQEIYHVFSFRLDMMTVSMMERMTGFDEQVIGPIDAACHFVQETLK